MGEPMWIYQGVNQEYILGVPQTDMTSAEYDALDKWQKDLIAATGLYLWQE